MATEVFNRFEKKYILTQEQFEKLMEILPKFMNVDVYNQNGKTYPICNLYLDTKDDFLIKTSLDKPVYKEKLRLRSYGKTPLDGTVFLEIKKKYKGLVNKRRTPMKLSEAYEYFENGKIPQNPELNSQVMKEIDYACGRYDVKPKVFIAYDRFAFFEKDDDDFRLTLDTNIRSRRINLKLETDTDGELLLDKGFWLMEAKAYKTFPLWFASFLSQNEIYEQSFSKYGSEYIRFVQKGSLL